MRKVIIAAVAAAFISTIGVVSAQFGYSTSFDAADGFVDGDSLSGSPGTAPLAQQWDTNDLANGNVGQSDYVGVVQGYTPGSNLNDYYAFLGGLLRPTVTPGSDKTFLYRNFNVSVANGGNGSFVFDIDFSISSSNNTFAAKDTFAWTLRGAGDVELLSLQFRPNNQNLSGVDSDKLGVFLESAQGTVNSNFATFYDAIYHLTISVSDTSLATVAFTDTSAMPVTATVLSGVNVFNPLVAPSDVTQAAATWTLFNMTTGAGGSKTGAGANAIIFNNFAAVPEPSTVALIAIGGIGAVATAMRRRQTG